MNTRAVAAHTLTCVIRQKSSLDAALESNIKRVTDNDHALYRELCFGTCRYFFSLEYLLSQLLSKPLKNTNTDIKALVMVGLYQLWQLRVPDHAAINETVNGTIALKKAWAKNLVNGVLRRFTRERELLLHDAQLNSHQEHPAWLAARIRTCWPDQWQAILRNNNDQAPMTLRVNKTAFSRGEYSERLAKNKIAHRNCLHAAEGITLEQAIDVNQLPQFSEGACSVQDEAAQLCAELLKLAPGQRVLDACCAPGGKTCHIAEKQPQLAELVAIDRDVKRLQRVNDNLLRLCVKAKVLQAEAQKLASWWDQVPFDRILLDAPCSATGVIRRHPDIKLLRRREDLENLCRIQRKLLSELWPTLIEGGLLVYATCSILPEENEKLVGAFVEQQIDAIHLPIDTMWGEARPYGRQLLPAAGGHDGFYYCVIRKGVE